MYDILLMVMILALIGGGFKIGQTMWLGYAMAAIGISAAVAYFKRR